MEQPRSGKRILPEDMRVEILSRLPVKSLLRFRSVCKRWNYLITSYTFRKLHRRIHSSSPPLLLAFHSSETDGNRLTTFDLYGNVVQQCLLPISSPYLKMLNIPPHSKLVCFFNYSSNKFFSYNPSTRHNFRLPDPPCLSLQNIKVRSSGLSYNQSRDEYMLLHLVNTRPHFEWFCEVLTFSISEDNFGQLLYNEWRSIKFTPKLNNDYLCLSGVSAAGAFYWEACDQNGNFCIFSLNIETEVFTTFGVPRELYFGGRLMELKDEIYILEEEKVIPPILELWKLFTDVNGNKSWALYLKINLTSIGISIFPYEFLFDRAIFVRRLEYLQCYYEPYNVLRELGILKLEDNKVPDWDVQIHTNLFTL